MYKTIFFDLDGTLLPMDFNYFSTNYFGRLTKACSHVLDANTFPKHLWASTEAMIRDNCAEKTNQEVFMEDFIPRFNLPADQLMPLFDQFYATEFPELISCTSPTPLARKICQELVEKGYQLVLATNPIFPDAATAHRMRWAGIDDIPWALVTTYEHCHFCKPNPNYYHEILQRVGAKAEETLMVGNDTHEDLVARKLGIKTYLVKDNLIDHGEKDYETDFEGRLEDFLNFARQLPKLKQP
ncbi:Haloacid dehalogenase domain protein hydrolase [Desulforamulus reducens MI-1]|uniref:Haloacid dehalogenase domain protein hydrolase n=1 Tax=Desulforamulus reducens (strain ATCC BAA-1160 / DSM 100696 / MI-1) TaxID=349161 RepID=A4J2I9_DESRM|nr:HAD family hydrolase [Desulforamulus reducens]ABO49292.1 Haloacid dehalogenase domain protein hydrolase [Desulforamulus reducens MI-1]